MSELLSGILVLLHLGIAGGGLVWLLRHYWQRPGHLRHSIVAEGTVVALETDGLRWLDEFPVVRFQSGQGQWLTLRCQRSRRAAHFLKGQKVKVRYPAAAPEQYVILGRLELLLA